MPELLIYVQRDASLTTIQLAEAAVVSQSRMVARISRISQRQCVAFLKFLECRVLLGSYDFQLKILTAIIEAYEHFLFEKLSAIKAVQEIHSTVALSEIKLTTELPLSSRLKELTL
jgi:DNA-binding Lrp family transcriptional regulator